MASLDDMTVNITVTSNLITMQGKYQTRDGRAVRILATDMKDGNGGEQVVALVSYDDGEKLLTTDCYGNSNVRTGFDLIPVPTKHEGWGVKRSDPNEYGFSVFMTKRAAEKYLSEEDSRMPKSHIVPVTWES